MGVVQSSRECFRGSPHLRSEPAIVAGLAQATLKWSTVDWENLVADYDRIRDCIERVIPGFEVTSACVKVASTTNQAGRETTQAKPISRFTPFLITNSHQGSL